MPELPAGAGPHSAVFAVEVVPEHVAAAAARAVVVVVAAAGGHFLFLL